MPTILRPTVLAADDPTVSGDDLAHTPPSTGRRTSTKVVAGSLLMGLASAVVLVAGPFAGSGEGSTTGAILLGFAIGWALLATLSIRRGDGSHRWAAVPAAALGAHRSRAHRSSRRAPRRSTHSGGSGRRRSSASRCG